MAIATRESFPDAVDVILNILTQEEYAAALHILNDTMEEKDANVRLVEKYPDAALKLANKLVGNRTRRDDHTLFNLLKNIKTAKPELANEEIFIRLSNLME